MSFVDNPHETITENNLIITSYLDEAQNLLIVKMMPNDAMIHGNYNTAYSLIEEDYYEIKICGELIKNNTGFNILAIFNSASAYDNWTDIAVDENTYNIFASKNHNVTIQDINNKSNYINLRTCQVNKYNSYYFYRSPITEFSETFEPTENAFMHYNKFYSDYNEKIASFKIFVPDLINQDKYFSTAYELGDTFNLAGTLEDADAFYIDTSYTIKQPNTYSKTINEKLIVLLNPNVEFTTIRAQLEYFKSLNSDLNNWTGTWTIACYQNDSLENPHYVNCAGISVDLESGTISFIFEGKLQRYVDIETFLRDGPNKLESYFDNADLFAYILGISNATISFIN